MEKRSVGYYTGCLLGGAVGDALGAPVEFMTISEIRRRYGAAGITGYVEYVSGDGEFTDDTQMTLFTAEALLRARHRAQLKGIGGALSEIAHQSYLRWLSTQGFKTSQIKRRSTTVGLYSAMSCTGGGLLELLAFRRCPAESPEQ